MRLSRFVILAAVACAMYWGIGKQSVAGAAPDPHHPEHKWACTPISQMGPNEIPAHGAGAPMCKEGYAATEWLCLPDGLIPFEERGGVTKEGQPKCRAGFTASEQPHLNSEDSRVRILKELPPITHNGLLMHLDHVRPKAASKALIDVPANYFYETGDYNETTTSGVSGNFVVGKPFLAPVNVSGEPMGHTLGQIAAIFVQTVTTGGVTKNITQSVEMGWTVDAQLNGPVVNTLKQSDLRPYLFVARSVNGNYFSPAGQSCYNTTKDCDFRAISSSAFTFPRILREGQNVGLAISHRAASGSLEAGWYMTVTLSNVTSDIGYYPDSVWAGVTPAFVQANHVQWFGEVALPVVNGTMAPATAAMGNGRWAEDDTSAATVTNTMIMNSAGVYTPVTPTLSSNQKINVTGSTILKADFLYENLKLSASSFAYGGPGLASNKAYVPVCGVYDFGDIYLGTTNFYTDARSGYDLSTLNDKCVGTALSEDATKLYIAAHAVGLANGPSANEILAINPLSGKIIGQIPAPLAYNIALTPDGEKLLVVNGETGTTTSLQIIDTNPAHTSTYNTVIATVPLNSTAYSIAIGPDGNEAYITGTNQVFVFDIPSGSFVQPIQVGTNPYFVTVSPDGTLLYVAYGGGGTSQNPAVYVSKIVMSYKSDGTMKYSYGRGTDITKAGFSPEGIAFAPDSSTAYISWTPFSGLTSGTLTAVNTASQQLTDLNPLGSQANIDYFLGAVGVTPDGRFVYLVTQGGSPAGKATECGASVSYCASALKIDTATNKLLNQTFFPNDLPSAGDAQGAYGNFTGGR